MSTDAPFTPPKKKRSVYWWIGGFVLLLLLAFLYQLFGPNPPIVVSRETTYITEPLMDDGLPDYERYTLGQLRAGITPENNAAALLWRAVGPGKLDASQCAVVTKELGLDAAPSLNSALVPVSDKANLAHVVEWLRQKEAAASPKITDSPSSGESTEIETETFTSDEAFDDRADKIITDSAKQAWTSGQIPPLAIWVTNNKVPLDLLVEASRRPRCYFPYLSLLNGENEMLFAMENAANQNLRDAAKSLVTRAMCQTGEKRFDEAWQDLLATHRIGRLIAQAPNEVEQVVGIGVDSSARDGTLALLDGQDLTPEQSREIQRDLASLDDFHSLADTLSSNERLAYLDAITQIAVRKKTDWLDVDVDLSLFTRFSVDWNVSLQKGNQLFDRLAAAARLPDHAARRQALSDLDAERAELSSHLLSTKGGVLAVAISPARRSDAVAQSMLILFGPASRAFCEAEDRANTLLRMERLAAALAIHRAERGAYPEKLDDLLPGILSKLPVDLYQAKPFIYKRTDKGYLLYTTGENGVDDGGSNEQMSMFEGRDLDGADPTADEALRAKIPKAADDYSIRLPVPPFKLPKPSTPQPLTAP
jgi:hypothetical protein